MKTHIEPIAKLIAHFRKLPGVGAKTAERYAYSIINRSREELDSFTCAILDAKIKTRLCLVCGTYSDKDVCDICARRDRSIICVVAEPKDVISMEKVRDYKGVYHVLMGTISPMEGRGADDIRVKELVQRVSDGSVHEVIMATNPDVEGEATAYYIARLLTPLGVVVTRLAQGIAIGSDLEYADEVTLTRAFDARAPLLK